MPWQFHEDVPMSMKRIRQMSDPLLAQDAATKKYVDDKVGSGGGGGAPNDEVIISDVQPRDASVELWVDWDAVSQTPAGTDEVFVQSGTPSMESAELWLDLDADSPGGSLLETVAALAAEVARLRSDLDALKAGG